MLRLRNKGIRRVRVSDLEDAPWNFRTHPAEQRAALEGAIDELGFYGYPDVYETAEGRLRICDGHLRKGLLVDKYGPDAEIDVNLTDFDESEAKKATLTKDPIGEMATTDRHKLDAALRDIETGNEAIQELMADVAKEAGLYRTTEKQEPKTPPERPPDTVSTCPTCGQIWQQEPVRKKLPKANAAHRSVNYHVKAGHLKKPTKCEECGNTSARIEAAHKDYDKPLDVRWLCVSCHRKWDKKTPKGGIVYVAPKAKRKAAKVK